MIAVLIFASVITIIQAGIGSNNPINPSNNQHEQGFEWEPISNNVCYSSKGDNPALIFMAKTGFLLAIKLVHRSGVMKCAAANTGSNWGCDDHTKLNVFVTDDKKAVIFPAKNQITPTTGNWYVLPGTMSTADQIVFSDFCNPTYVSNGDHFRIWWGEDLVNYSESDNVGEVCVKVYGVFKESTNEY